ncbi:hypothetical protein SVIOM74S_05710 [Streptomyces violarus]
MWSGRSLSMRRPAGPVRSVRPGLPGRSPRLSLLPWWAVRAFPRRETRRPGPGPRQVARRRGVSVPPSGRWLRPRPPRRPPSPSRPGPGARGSLPPPGPIPTPRSPLRSREPAVPAQALVEAGAAPGAQAPQDRGESGETALALGRRRRWRRRALHRAARQLRGALRPAASADLPAQAGRHGGRAVEGDRRVHGVHPGDGAGLGPGRDDRVPRRRGHAARSEGGTAAARRRGGGRGRPRAARSPGPAVRPAAPVPRVQADRRHLQRAVRRRGPALSAYRRAGAPPCRAAARSGHQHRRGRVRQARREGDAAQAQAAGVRRPHPRPAGQRAGAGRDRRRAAPGAAARPVSGSSWRTPTTP